MTTAAAPQGWYPDPQNQGQLRWWDGTNWGNQTQPSAFLPPPPAAAPSPPPSASGATSGPGAGVVPPAAEAPKHRLFGGKKDLEEEVAQLRATVAAMGIPERDALRAEVIQLNAELPAMRAEKASLEAALVPLRSETQSLQSLQAQAVQIQGEVAQLTSQRDGLVAETSPAPDHDRGDPQASGAVRRAADPGRRNQRRRHSPRGRRLRIPPPPDRCPGLQRTTGHHFGSDQDSC